VPEDLDQIAAPAAEHKQIASMGIALQPLLNLQSQPIHAAPHVGVPSGDPTRTSERIGIIGAAP
jgi:hypothetical protein